MNGKMRLKTIRKSIRNRNYVSLQKLAEQFRQFIRLYGLLHVEDINFNGIAFYVNSIIDLASYRVRRCFNLGYIYELALLIQCHRVHLKMFARFSEIFLAFCLPTLTDPRSNAIHCAAAQGSSNAAFDGGRVVASTTENQTIVSNIISSAPVWSHVHAHHIQLCSSPIIISNTKIWTQRENKQLFCKHILYELRTFKYIHLVLKQFQLLHWTIAE